MAADLETQKQDLKALLEVGLTVQMISAIVTFALIKNKEDFLKKLNELIDSFNKSLLEEEKRELKEDIDRLIEQKAQDFLTELGENLSEEEVDQAITELKSVIALPQV